MRKAKRELYDMLTPLKERNIKKTYRDIAGELNIEIKTLYNWRASKKRYNLLKLILQGYFYNKAIKNLKETNMLEDI